MPNNLPHPLFDKDEYGTSTKFADSEVCRVLMHEACKLAEKYEDSSLGQWQQRNEVGVVVAEATSHLVSPPVGIGLGIIAQSIANAFGFNRSAEGNHKSSAVKCVVLATLLASTAPVPAVAAETEHRGCMESLGHATFCAFGLFLLYVAATAVSDMSDTGRSEPRRDDEPRELPGGASTHTVAPPYLGRMDDTLDQGCAWGSLEYGTCH